MMGAEGDRYIPITLSHRSCFANPVIMIISYAITICKWHGGWKSRLPGNSIKITAAKDYRKHSRKYNRKENDRVMEKTGNKNVKGRAAYYG